MKQVLSLVLLIICSVSVFSQNLPVAYDSIVVSSRKYANGNTYQKDLLLYANMLAKTHPYYDSEQHCRQLEKRVRTLYKDFNNIESVDDFRIRLQKEVSSLNDAHTSIYLGITPILLYPVILKIDTDKTAVILSADENISHIIGKRVNKINGLKVNAVLQKASQIISHDNNIFLYNILQQYFQIKKFWDICTPGCETLDLTFSDGTTISLEPASRDKINHPHRIQNDSGFMDQQDEFFCHKIFKDESICYLQFNRFADRITHPHMKQLPRFDNYIEQLMKEISEKAVKTLIVDLQYNGGGNCTLGDVLLSWLSPIDSLKGYSVAVRMSDLLLKTQPDFKNVKLKDGTSYYLGKIYNLWDFDWETLYSSNSGTEVSHSVDTTKHRFNNDPNKIFNGNIIFIEGRGSYSSSGLLLTTARDNGIGTIIGEVSGNKPSKYGDILQCVLPNTNTRCLISCRYFIRPNEQLKDEEVLIPDILLNLDDTDGTWKWITDFYGK